jgi:hypothetical protein
MSVFLLLWFLQVIPFVYGFSSLTLALVLCLSMYSCVERIFYRGLKIRCLSILLFFSAFCLFASCF